MIWCTLLVSYSLTHSWNNLLPSRKGTFKIVQVFSFPNLTSYPSWARALTHVPGAYIIKGLIQYGPTWTLFGLFIVKLFYNNHLQTGPSTAKFLYLFQVVFAYKAYYSRQEGVLARCHHRLMAIQDREVTIIIQTIAATMSLVWCFE